MNLFSPDRIAELQQNSQPAGHKSAGWQSLLQRVEAWCAVPQLLPTRPGGWIHNYICPTHWLPLLYDGDRPNDHCCSAGCRCEGAEYDEAWLAWRHRQIADMSREVALAYALTGNREFLAHVEQVFRHYVAFYSNYDGADSAEGWMLTARVFNQALTEALWAVPLLHAYDLVAADLDPDLKTEIETEFLRPLAGTMSAAQDKLIAEDNVKSNYMAWLNAVLGCVGYLLDDAPLIHRALDGEGGFVKHLSAAVLPDGMEYEVTPYYHNFVVLAYLILAEAAWANSRDLYSVRGEQNQSIAKMWQALSQLILPDGTIADLGDGSYWIDSVYDRELIEVYEIARVWDSDPRVANVLHHAYTRRGQGRDHWAALLFGVPFNALPEPPHNDIQSLPDSGVAILNASDQMTAVVPYGAYRGSHSHGDHLSVQIYPFSNDAGCVLYGIPARNNWYQTNYAHNTLIVDGQPQRDFSQATDAWNRNELSLVARNLYPGIVIRRSIAATKTAILDTVSADSDTPHQYDWVLHIDGDIVINIPTEPLNKLLDNEEQIALTAHAADVTAAHVTITHQSKQYALQLTAEHPFDLLIGTAPGTSWQPTARRHVLIGRTTASSQTYKAIYTVNHE